MKIGELKQGAKAQVVGYCDRTDCVMRLQEMGLTLGTEFQVTKIAPLGDPIEICFRCQRLVVRGKECDGIEIEPMVAEQ
ncbi:MAG: ferrous iron transport protein A [Armatimonadetes bacterium]|nr:ferrous iron transport protein A [Armatimonadota bacterium]